MGRRHTQMEITTLLGQAQQMAAQGKLQSDIAKALGVSVMTYHRWRKAHGADPQASPLVSGIRTNAAVGRDQSNPVAELYLENSRLRRLVADLLLEKMKLEEALKNRGAVRHLAGRA